MDPECRKRIVGQAIEDWYSSRYPLGVRLTFQQRASLAETIDYRLAAVDNMAKLREDDR